MIALSVAASAAGTLQARANASAQAKWQQQQFELNQEIISQNTANTLSALNRRRVEEDARASQAIQQNAQAADAAVSTATVAASEGGAAGGSVAALLQDFRKKEMAFTQAVNRNKMFRDTQIASEQRQAVLTGYSNLVNAQPTPIPMPNIFVESLRIAANAGRDYYMMGGGGPDGSIYGGRPTVNGQEVYGPLQADGSF